MSGLRICCNSVDLDQPGAARLVQRGSSLAHPPASDRTQPVTLQMDAGRGCPGCEFAATPSIWINLEQQGWYSADHHLHIPRPVTALNPSLSKWMQAEDVRVANLLQLGESTEFRSSPQYAFGKQSWYREGDYLLATGQENRSEERRVGK